MAAEAETDISDEVHPTDEKDIFSRLTAQTILCPATSAERLGHVKAAAQDALSLAQKANEDRLISLAAAIAKLASIARDESQPEQGATIRMLYPLARLAENIYRQHMEAKGIRDGT